jgi:hypothetical protein
MSDTLKATMRPMMGTPLVSPLSATLGFAGLYKERLLGQNLLTGQLPPTGAFF